MGQLVSTAAGDLTGDGLNVEKDDGDVASVGDGGGTGLRTRPGVVTRGGGPAEQLHRCHVVIGGGGGGGRSASAQTERAGNADKLSWSCVVFQTSRSLNLGVVPPSTINLCGLIVAGVQSTICSRRQVRGLGEPTLAGKVRALLGDCGMTVSPLVSLVVVCWLSGQ